MSILPPPPQIAFIALEIPLQDCKLYAVPSLFVGITLEAGYQVQKLLLMGIAW